MMRTQANAKVVLHRCPACQLQLCKARESAPHAGPVVCVVKAFGTDWGVI